MEELITSSRSVKDGFSAREGIGGVKEREER
jgi:hypothetical protein